MSDFKDSFSNATRILTWDAIKRSDLSANRRNILKAIVDLWFFHRGSPGYIHPGKGILARKAKVSEDTVKRALDQFRRMGFIVAGRYAKGGTGCATQYTVAIEEIWAAYLPPVPVTINGHLIEVRRAAANQPETGAKPVQNEPVHGPIKPGQNAPLSIRDPGVNQTGLPYKKALADSEGQSANTSNELPAESNCDSSVGDGLTLCEMAKFWEHGSPSDGWSN